MTTFRFDRKRYADILAGVGIFISTLILYRLTSYPTVAYIDSGELAVANWTLGIAHPTGYPLYTLLGRLFSLLPLELITTQNLFGSVCTSLATTVIFLTVRMLAGRFSKLSEVESEKPDRVSLLALSALTLVFAIANLVWSQGATNEVYSLHLLFLTLIVIHLFQPFAGKRLILIGFLAGLSVGNHMATILLLPSILAYLLLNRSAIVDRPMVFFYALVAFLLALSVYLYLPIRSSCDPLLNWGNPSTGEGFLRHVTGWQYRIWMFDQDLSQLTNQLLRFAGILYDQFPLAFWPLFAVGLFTSLRRHRNEILLLGLLFLANIIYSLNFSIPDIDNYLLPSVVVIFFFSARGVVTLSGVSSLWEKITLALILLSLGSGILQNWSKRDQSANQGAVDGLRNYFRSCDGPSLVLSANWDYVTPWFYLHYYQKEHPEIVMIDIELMRRSWYCRHLQNVDRDLAAYLRNEIEAFLPHVLQFERGEPYDQVEIERAYVATLQRMMSYPQRRIYFDLSCRFSFPPSGKIAVSGVLFSLLRKDEIFAPPPGPFTLPDFGKSTDHLDWREKWHLEMFQQMMNQGSQP